MIPPPPVQWAARSVIRNVRCVIVPGQLVRGHLSMFNDQCSMLNAEIIGHSTLNIEH